MELKNITIDPNSLYFIPLMGQEEEVGQCHLLGTKRAGFILLEYGFDANHDIVNIRSYLNDLRAVFLTHSHDDHMAGLVSYLAVHRNPKKTFPPIYALPFTLKKLENDLRGKRIPKDTWPKLFPIQEGDAVELGGLSIQAQPASHSVPSIGYVAREYSDGGSIFLTGDTTSGSNISPDTFIHKGISLLIIDASDVVIPGNAKKQEELSSQVYDLIKGGQDNFIFVLPPSRPLHVLAIKDAACKAGFGLIYSHPEYKKDFLNVFREMGITIEERKNKNVIITDSLENIHNISGKYRCVFIGRSPKKIASDQVYLPMSTHILQDDILDIISAVRPMVTIPTHCREYEETQFRRICQSKKISHIPRKILNGTIFEIKRNMVTLRNRLMNIERVHT